VAFKKGEKRSSEAGRRKGTVNLVTKQVRDMVMRAIEFKGGVEYFIWAAENEPRAFLALAGKCIPQAIEGKIEITHTHKIVDYTVLGDPNAQQEDENLSETDYIDIQAGSPEETSIRLEAGGETSLEIPLNAIDRGSIPIPVSVKPRGTAGT